MEAICRYGELFLRKANRGRFIQQLTKNMMLLAKKSVSTCSVKLKHQRMIITTNDDSWIRRVFGIVSYSICEKTNFADIRKKVLEKAQTKGSFRISVQRVTKTIKKTSMELNKELGTLVVEKTGRKVDLHKPNQEIGIDIVGDSAYIYDQKIKCFGGLPTGIEGSVFLDLKDKASELAGLLMMKRGCSLILKGESNLIDKYAPSYGKNPIAEVSAETIDSVKIKKTLKPLIGMTSEEIEEKLKKYEANI